MRQRDWEKYSKEFWALDGKGRYRECEGLQALPDREGAFLQMCWYGTDKFTLTDDHIKALKSGQTLYGIFGREYVLKLGYKGPRK